MRHINCGALIYWAPSTARSIIVGAEMRRWVRWLYGMILPSNSHLCSSLTGTDITPVSGKGPRGLCLGFLID
ncbi:hypothetical protein XENTR_v10017686 [Xenopus tropicalis]|nr:hypothetical protein XENTR_v10017686 [Xenopus tropicalis]